MPRYMLETNMCIYLMKQQPVSVARRFADCHVGDVVMSAITYGELEYGLAASSNPEQDQVNLASLIEDIPAVPFDEAAEKTDDPIRFATLESKKDHLDKLIAAHAASLEVSVVANNEKDFSNFPSVLVENWLSADDAT